MAKTHKAFKGFTLAPIKLEYWDGSSWRSLASETYVDSKTWDINTATTGSLQIPRLAGYPNNALMFLNGGGAWVNPLTIITNDLNNLASGFTVKNTNPAAVSAGLTVDSYQTGTAVQFGFNNSTNEAYVWVSGSGNLKFGTNSTARMTLLNNGTLDMMNNGIINCANFDINNNTTGQLNLSRLQGYPNNANLLLKGNGTWDYVAKNGSYYLIPGTGAFTDHVLLVNSVGKFGAGKYNAVCYGESGQAAAEFFYNSVLKSYINSSGTLTISSDRKLKDSLRKKDIWGKDYLQRILDLDIYSYTWKHKKSKSHDPHHVQVGLLYEDVAKLFNGNALSHPKAREGFACEDKHCPSCTSTINGIKPVEIMYYLILAFQSFYHKEYLPLKQAVEKQNTFGQEILSNPETER